MFNFGELLNKNKFLVILIGFLILVVFLFLISLFLSSKNQNQNPIPLPSPTKVINTTTPFKSNKFSVISTIPKNSEDNVYSGEIEISFTTNVDLISPNEFKLEIQPPLPNYWKFENTYPTKQVKARVYGGLKTNTQYFLTIKNVNNETIYSWSFKTSDRPVESSSKLNVDEDTKILQQYYPLYKFIPFASSDFEIKAYVDKLTLKVIVKNPDIEKVKQEVKDWITLHGVDPNTHVVKYINSF